MKNNKFENMYIYLDNGQKIELKYPEDAFEEILNELNTAMKAGTIFAVDASYDVDMQDCAGNYLSALNGAKIVGYTM